MEDDDEYEKERQETIKANAELMKSLGLGFSVEQEKTKQVPRAPKIELDKSSSPTLTRSSSRLSQGPRRSYNEKEKTKNLYQSPASEKREKLPPRQGSRKSSRLGPGGERRQYRDWDSDSEGQDDTYVPDSLAMQKEEAFRVVGPELKKLKNPTFQEAEWNEEDQDDELPWQPLPTREPPRNGKSGNGTLIFENANRHFRPNVTPEEMLRGGVFGGTIFRPYHSTILRQDLNPEDDLYEFPESWYSGLDISSQLTSPTYDSSVNRYGVKAGQTLEDWEKSGWVRHQDPRGWFQWYFRFYLGRRTRDDARQIGRWLKACGPAGRFKRSLVTKVARVGKTWDDETVTPVVRQTLFHWAYVLTEADYQDYLP